MPNIVNITTIFNPLSLLAPHSCRGCGRLGSILCDRCKNNIISHRQNYCPICKEPNQDGYCPNCPDFPRTFTADERSNLIGDLVHSFKFESIRALAEPLGDLVHQILPSIPGPVEVVPLPTIGRHIRERGFDHTYLIANSLVRHRGKNWRIAKLLIRTKNNVQVGSNRRSRLTQAKDAYTLKPKAIINPANTYLLLDDVWTTGASMRAAIKKLQDAGAVKIIVVILALSRID